MLIKNWMNKTVINVDANDSVLEALKLIKQHKIHLLPVTKDGELVGIITGRDMERALAFHTALGDKRAPSEETSIIKARDVITKNPVTVPMDGNVEEVAEILLKHNISSVLVTHHDGEVAGTFSQSDGLNALITVTGIKKKASSLLCRWRIIREPPRNPKILFARTAAELQASWFRMNGCRKDIVEFISAWLESTASSSDGSRKISVKLVICSIRWRDWIL